MEFSRELRDAVMSGDITVSFRLWRRPKVKEGGRYPVGPAQIEVDCVELVPFASITADDVRRSGEKDREALRRRAAHAGPVADDTLLYRVEFHLTGSPAALNALLREGETEMATVSVRYIVTDIDAAIGFYTRYLGFSVQMHPNDMFAMLTRGDLRLVLSVPGNAPGGGQAMPDGTLPQPGGWNRSRSRCPTWPPPSRNCGATASGSATTW